jgi:hypothetical protein
MTVSAARHSGRDTDNAPAPVGRPSGEQAHAETHKFICRSSADRLNHKGGNAMNPVQDFEQPILGPLGSKRRRFLGVAVSIFLCLALVIDYFAFSSMGKTTSPYVVAPQKGQEDITPDLLQGAVAEADRLDPGWRIDELEKKRVVIPDEQNSAVVIEHAKSLLPENWPFWYYADVGDKMYRSKEEMRILQQMIWSWSFEPSVQLHELQTKALLQELGRAEKALAAARKVAQLPRGRCAVQDRKDLTRKRDFMSTLNPSGRGIADLLAYDVLLRTEQNDFDGALASCQAIINCGRAIGDEPNGWFMLVRDDLHWLATRRLERILGQGEPSESSLSSIQHEFAEEAEVALFLLAARGERAETDDALQRIEDGNVDPNDPFRWVGLAGTPFNSREILDIASRNLPLGGTEAHRRVVMQRVKFIRPIFLKESNRLVEFAKLPTEQQVRCLKVLDHGEKLATRFHCNKARLRCAVAMLAVERYRRANKRWPDGLADLVPTFLLKVPLDPFDAAPLRYRRLDDGVAIYSVGPDGEDNSGKFDIDSMKPGTDLGLRLWDVAKRRKPSKSTEATFGGAPASGGSLRAAQRRTPPLAICARKGVRLPWLNSHPRYPRATGIF